MKYLFEYLHPPKVDAGEETSLQSNSLFFGNILDETNVDTDGIKASSQRSNLYRERISSPDFYTKLK